MADTSKIDTRYSEIVCIGLGLSGVCLGAQLKRKWNFQDMHFYDRNETYSGTWWLNHYPGAACDVPIFLYSYSFAQKQAWSRILPGYNEIRSYVSRVVSEHGLLPHMTFQTECEAAIWDEERALWSLNMRNIVSGDKFIHECRILFSAVGLLSQPYVPVIPGSELFQGESFHTAQWKDDVSLDGKDIVVLGNGCTASQLVPTITPRAKSVTQIFQTPHWLIYAENTQFPPSLLRVNEHLPFFARFLRGFFLLLGETGWLMFVMNGLGARMRKSAENASKAYVMDKAPERYRDILIPNYGIGCKRRIFDADGAYLKALHSDNILLTKEKVLEIKPNGVLTDQTFYPADVIVYATGFRTNSALGRMRVRGENGLWLDDHWNELGGPSAYNSLSVAGFPNFFMLYGPNSNTGHTSVVMTVENAINGAFKVIAPLLKGQATKVTVRKTVYENWAARVQIASKERVFGKEACNNWYVSKSGWNGTTYPWSQIYFWWRQTFPNWKDWEYTYCSPRPSILVSKLMWTLIAPVLTAGGFMTHYYAPDLFQPLHDYAAVVTTFYAS